MATLPARTGWITPSSALLAGTTTFPLSVGGSDTMKAFASFAYDDDKGGILNTYARKFSAKG